MYRNITELALRDLPPSDLNRMPEIWVLETLIDIVICPKDNHGPDNQRRPRTLAASEHRKRQVNAQIMQSINEKTA